MKFLTDWVDKIMINAMNQVTKYLQLANVRLNEDAGEVRGNRQSDSTHGCRGKCHLFIHVFSEDDNPLRSDEVTH